MLKRIVIRLCLFVGFIVILNNSGNSLLYSQAIQEITPAIMGLQSPSMAIELDRITPEEKEQYIQAAMSKLWLYQDDLTRNIPQSLSIEGTNGQIAHIGLDGRLWLMNSDGSASYWIVERINNLSSPIWSSDNQLIVFIGDCSNGIAGRCLYQYNFELGDYHLLVSGFASIWSPSWSPQNGHLLFIGEKVAGAGYHTYVLARDGTGLTELVPQLSQSWSPAWVDEDTITVPIEDPTNIYKLYTVDLDAPDDPHAITPEFSCSSECSCSDTDVWLGYPETSPDNGLIAFVGGRTEGSKLGGCIAYYGLYLVDPEGLQEPAKKIDIADTSAGNVASAGSVHWAANNDTIAVYASNSDALLRLNTYVMSTNTFTILHSLEGGTWNRYDWAPDASLIAAGYTPVDQLTQVNAINPTSDIYTNLSDGFDPDWSTKPASPLIDLWVNGIEVTQAIQRYPENNITLVEKKDVWVRVYIQSSPSDLEDVTARLILTKEGQADKIVMPRNTVTAIIDGSERADLAQTINFYLPADEVWSTGRIGFRVEVGPDKQFPESNYENNVFPTYPEDPKYFTFTATKTIQINSSRFIFTDEDGKVYSVTPGEVSNSMPFTYWTFPESSNGWDLEDSGTIDVKTKDYNLCYESGWQALIRKLAENCPAESSETETRCLGWVPGEVSRAFTLKCSRHYWGYYTGTKALVTEGYQFLPAHELGHTFGLGDYIGSCPKIDLYGFHGDLLYQKVYKPEDYNKFMDQSSDCGILDNDDEPGTMWIASEANTAIYDRVKIVADALNFQNVFTTTQTYLGVSGVVTPGLTADFFSLYTFDKPVGYADTTGDGQYRMDLLDSSDTILYSHYFNGGAFGGDLEEEADYFVVVMPRPEGTRKAIVWDGDTKLAEVNASEHVPQIQLLTALDALNLTGDMIIEWDGSDADGDVLNYLIEYSADGGLTWKMLAVDLTDESYVLHTEYLRGTTQGKLKVAVSDGLNSASSVSEGVFSVDPNSPNVTIVSPVNDLRVQPGLWIGLVGEANDLEDGELFGEALVWTLEDATIIGTSNLVTIDDLGYGRHTITLTATDSDGMSSSVSITLTITDFPYVMFVPSTFK